MSTRLPPDVRAICCDFIAKHLTEIASQESLNEAHYNAKIEYLQRLGDAYFLDVLRACTEDDMLVSALRPANPQQSHLFEAAA